MDEETESIGEEAQVPSQPMQGEPAAPKGDALAPQAPASVSIPEGGTPPSGDSATTSAGDEAVPAAASGEDTKAPAASGEDAAPIEPEEEETVEEKRQRLLVLVDSLGKVSISEAGERLSLDKLQVNRYAEELAKQNKIKVESHYLREPDLESLNFKKAQKDMDQADKKLDMKTPETPNSRKSKTKEKKVIEEYILTSDEDIHLKIRIMDDGDFVPHYQVSIPHIDFVTRALLDETKKALINEVRIGTKDVYDTDKFQKLKVKFVSRAKEKLRNVLKKSSDEYVSTLSKLLVNEMLGLGDIEYLLLDDGIEEIVVNSSKEPVWVYHKKYKWTKTNIILPTEDLINNYASRVAREVGREITHLKPLLDAHLTTGDRVNATLAPISSNGNTMTIRRFSRTPWSAIHLIQPHIKTISPEVAAFLWLALEFELSVLVAGGTAAGKTSFLNAIMPFMPASQRIISIEDTRELNLPEFLHWLPMTTRNPNPEGEGGISMLDLLQNSLRMRPDRIIVGEVRARKEAEVLFESMHTGHSVYGTFHAERAQEVVDRITSPPMNIPGQVMKSLHLIVNQYRNRRTGARRTFEICEVLKDDGDKPKLNTLYKWNPKTDQINKMYPSIRIAEEISMFTGMSEKDIEENLKDKQVVLEYLLANGIMDVNKVGRVVTEFYLDREDVLDTLQRGGKLNIPDLYD